MSVSTPLPQLLVPADSNWRSEPAAELDIARRYWLTRPGALTAGLRKLGRVDLRVSQEYPSTLTDAEAWMLNQSAGSAVWVREIVMAINEVDCVFARSLTPLAASEGMWQAMRTLQTRPLADLLYHDPEIGRSPFYVCQLQDGQPLHEAGRRALGQACPPAAQLLARCSVFWRCRQPLVVAECFLPEFWAIAPAAEPGRKEPDGTEPGH